MDRLKFSGFYKLKFFITPDEFKEVLQLFEQKQARFHRTNYDQTEHDQAQVWEDYQKYYQYFTKQEKPDYYPFFVYSIPLSINNKKSGFFVRNESIRFPDQRQWAEDEWPYIMLSLPKGVQIDAEDEKGKYYIYEDLREHQPLTYAFFDEVATHIKKMTKPLRFSAHTVDALQEQKPSVRISKNAANDMVNSWMFKKYKLVMTGK